MKQTIICSNTRKVIPYRPKKALIYPNAAQREDRIHKILDGMLTGAVSAGIVTALMFLITLQ